MAIFGLNKKKSTAKTVKNDKAVVATAPQVHSGTHMAITNVIVKPRITEKSGIQSQGGVYTFEVTKSANKNTVIQAVHALYKVRPVKVAIINSPSKAIIHGGRRGTVPGFKKAVVSLKKGDKIEFV
jgi:large subunit ribosomal protein L23